MHFHSGFLLLLTFKGKKIILFLEKESLVILLHNSDELYAKQGRSKLKPMQINFASSAHKKPMLLWQSIKVGIIIFTNK